MGCGGVWGVGGCVWSVCVMEAVAGVRGVCVWWGLGCRGCVCGQCV